MAGKLYEYAVLFHPKPRKESNGEMVTDKSELVTPVTHVLASTENEVSIIAARSIPEKYLDKLEQMEIKVRPF